MNLLSLIIIFLALAACGSIAYIAWALTREAERQNSPTDNSDTPGAEEPPEQS